MKIISEEEFELETSGRRIYGNCGYIGIAPNPSSFDGSWSVVGGFDGTISFEDGRREDLTKVERLELAEFMRNAWSRWAER